MSTATVSADSTTLARWVHDHAAVWEISVRHEAVAGHRTITGLALTLAAQCRAHCRMDPSCPTCQETQEKLQEIALAVLPRGVTHWFDALEPTLQMRRGADWAPEVEATVIFCAPTHDVLPDDAVVEGVRERLARMGARPRT